MTIAGTKAGSLFGLRFNLLMAAGTKTDNLFRQGFDLSLVNTQLEPALVVLSLLLQLPPRLS